MSPIKMARILGWASLAIGASEFVAPGMLQRVMGIQGHKTLLRSYGLREALVGFGLLTASRPQALGRHLWGRVGGDAIDIASLAVAARSTRRPVGLAVVAGAVLGITALDAIYARQLQPELPRKDLGRQLAHAVL